MSGDRRPPPSRLHDLFVEHGEGVRRALARLAGPALSADDLVQEVFVVALRRQREFGPDGPPVAWLYGVAGRVATAARRKQQLRQFFGLDDAAEPTARGTPESAFEQVELARQLYRVLEQLSEAKRTVFILHELQGMEGGEIAAALGCPPKTVWTRLARAREEVAEGLRKLAARDQEALDRERR